MKQLSNLFLHKKTHKPKECDEKTLYHILLAVVKEEYGKQGAQACHFVHYKPPTLTIKVKKAVWANELWMHRDNLIKKVQKKCSQKSILKEIKIIR